MLIYILTNNQSCGKIIKLVKYAGMAHEFIRDSSLLVELAASRTSAPKWRRSEFEKAQKQGELRVRTKQGDYVSSCHAGAAARKTI